MDLQLVRLTFLLCCFKKVDLLKSSAPFHFAVLVSSENFKWKLDKISMVFVKTKDSGNFTSRNCTKFVELYCIVHNITLMFSLGKDLNFLSPAIIIITFIYRIDLSTENRNLTVFESNCLLCIYFAVNLFTTSGGFRGGIGGMHFPPPA